MLLAAKGKYFDSAPGTRDRRTALMRIGVLMHIFADMVAHQMFSGFNAKVNRVSLSNVTNNITNNDETKKYNDYIVSFLGQLAK